jgi:hypothetical protein
LLNNQENFSLKAERKQVGGLLWGQLASETVKNEFL